MRTITRLYDTHDAAKSAVKGLENAGVSSDDISIVSRKGDDIKVEEQGSYAEEGAGAGIGAGVVAGGAGGLLAGLGMLAIPGIGPVVAAGWLASTAAGAAVGAVAGGAVGGIVGAMISEGVPEDEANVYAEGVRRGGSLVIARIKEEGFSTAEGILQSSQPVDVNARRTSYTEEGWSRFNDVANPYSDTEVLDERKRRL